MSWSIIDDGLPNTDQVEHFSCEELAKIVLDLRENAARLNFFENGHRVNGFLAEAACKLAENYPKGIWLKSKTKPDGCSCGWAAQWMINADPSDGRRICANCGNYEIATPD